MESKHSVTEGLRAEASRILLFIFGRRHYNERQQAFEREQTQLNGQIQGPVDPDHLPQRQQQMDAERGRLNGVVRGPEDPDLAHTRLEMLRELQTGALGASFQHTTQVIQRAVAAEMAALQQRMQAQQAAQQDWQARSQQQGR